jgi:hypothetical protein
MFFVARLALYTCAFYLAVALVLQAVVLAFTYWKGFGIFFAGRMGIATFAGFWGIIWFVSFMLAFRIVFHEVWARFVR